MLCLNETNCCFDRLPNGIDDILLDGFHEPLIQAPIRKSGRGGGLVMYINKRVCEQSNIEYFQVKQDPSDTSGEFQCIKIHNCKGFNKTKLIINVWIVSNALEKSK